MPQRVDGPTRRRRAGSVTWIPKRIFQVQAWEAAEMAICSVNIMVALEWISHLSTAGDLLYAGAFIWAFPRAATYCCTDTYCGTEVCGIALPERSFFRSPVV